MKNDNYCVELAIQNPPTQGDRVKIFNQVTETHSLKSLADLIQATFPNVEHTTVQNPRNELQAKQFLDLGSKPYLCNKGRAKNVEFIVAHKSAIVIFLKFKKYTR